MDEFLQSVSAIARLIKQRAIDTMGPWPRELELLVFCVGSEWKCGLSPATQHVDIEYREGVLRIARDLQETVRVEQ
jgi:hypothetical protein